MFPKDIFPEAVFPKDVFPDDVFHRSSETTQEEKQFIAKEFGNEQTTVDRRK